MKRGRRAGSIVKGMLAIAIVLTLTYAAAAMLSPLPRLHVEQTLSTAIDGAWNETLTLPDSGSTAVLAGPGSATSAGDAEPRPIAGAAKLVLVSVVLATEPLEPGNTGAATTIDQAAVDRYRALDAVGARTVSVQFAQTLTRRDLIAATLIGSGNNTAELLVDDVFGGLDAYRAAARTWLDEQGLANTTVTDGTGLDPGSRSTASELAELGRLAFENPFLADLLDMRPRTTSAGSSFGDLAAFVPELDTIGLVRSYTDAAGVCVVLGIPVGDEIIVVAMLGQPSYPAAESAAEALISEVRESVRQVEVVSAGQVVAVARSSWGQSTDLVATEAVIVSSTALDGLGARIQTTSRSTIGRGADAGSLVVTAGGVEQVVRLEAANAISEPGVAWRFADPITVFSRWFG